MAAMAGKDSAREIGCLPSIVSTLALKLCNQLVIEDVVLCIGLKLCNYLAEASQQYSASEDLPPPLPNPKVSKPNKSLGIYYS
eukprot:4223945-Amphidinium_carterae.1